MNARAFSLPDFTRITWASSRAREVWEPRIARITAAWTEIERLSVTCGYRPSALQMCMPEDLPALMAKYLAQGWAVVVLERVGVADSYASSSAALVTGQPWQYRIALTNTSRMAAWVNAWRLRDDEAIGQLLGFPACCRAFFARTWGAGSVDPTGQMDGVDAPVPALHGRAVANPLLRWLGVRLLPHMPCAFSCVESHDLGHVLVEVGRANGFADEIAWTLEMLNWPIEWSALHGIAEIKTPILKIATRTDYTPALQVVRWEGTGYPAEGVSGNAFPYQRPATVHPITLHRSFKAAFAPPAPVDDWTDNGFTSLQAQSDAHDMILEALSAAPPRGRVFDLGCGNGLLLEKIAARFNVPVLGIDENHRKVSRCGRPYVRDGAIGEIGMGGTEADAVDVVLVSRRRFDEGCEPAVRSWARAHAQRLLVYSYDAGDRGTLLEEIR